jgi:hypothetical protein
MLPLLLGAAFGVALAAYGIARPSAAHGALPSGVIASVNGVPIHAQDHDRALAALTLERREGGMDGDQKRVLDRLIDELPCSVRRAGRRRDTCARSAWFRRRCSSASGRSASPDERREAFSRARGLFSRADLVREQLFFGVAPAPTTLPPASAPGAARAAGWSRAADRRGSGPAPLLTD